MRTHFTVANSLECKLCIWYYTSFIIPRTVLFSSIQPEVQTLNFSTLAILRNLQKILRTREHKQRQRCQASNLGMMSRVVDPRSFKPICAYFCNLVTWLPDYWALNKNLSVSLANRPYIFYHEDILQKA